ncbi:MAG: PAS domain-containing protein [Deltaproteobacteria bacterium]
MKKALRESIVFAQQNLISDPPFSKLDLISCRNLLIYLEPEIQKKIIALFHFSLNRNGFLFLGNSEGIAQQKNLFSTISKKWRIFRKIGMAQTNLEMPVSLNEARYQGLVPAAGPQARRPRLTDMAREILLERFVPASVLIDNSFQVLYFHGPHENYLVQPPGEPTTDLLSIAREGLRTRLRGAVSTALKKNEEVMFADGRVKRGSSFYRVKVTVTPLRDEQRAEGLLLVTFEDMQPSDTVEHRAEEYSRADESVVHQLEEELRITKEELQSTIEELETSNEELKSSNEEVMSMNEELQSANEELETSKEELQSMNEELTTVNAQLEEKIKEVEATNDDLNNLLSSTDIATIFLDTNLRIKRYTPAVQEIFNYLPSDVGRPLTDLSHHSLDPDLPRACRQELDHLQPDQREIRTEKGQWFIRRTLPYRTEDNRIAGVVVTFTDVNRIKQAEEKLRKAKGLAEAMNDLNEMIHSTLTGCPSASWDSGCRSPI